MPTKGGRLPNYSDTSKARTKELEEQRMIVIDAAPQKSQYNRLRDKT